jgi:hypothetical protein
MCGPSRWKDAAIEAAVDSRLSRRQKNGNEIASFLNTYQSSVVDKHLIIRTKKLQWVGLMKTSVALIGFMGTGKSAVGAVLAERLGKKFIEVDYLIEQKGGKPIPQIFEDEGEITFRELEIETIKQIAGRSNQVIACGGGAVLNRIKSID